MVNNIPESYTTISKQPVKSQNYRTLTNVGMKRLAVFDSCLLYVHRVYKMYVVYK